MAGSSWTDQLVNLIILSAAQQGFSGFFTYSPAPGAGNLIGSVSAVPGTDQFGNHYLLGIASYAIGFASAVTAGSVVFYSGSLAAGWTQQGIIFVSGGQMFLQPTGGITLNAAGVQLTSGAALAIPQSSAGITTVGQLVAALINVGILS